VLCLHLGQSPSPQEKQLFSTPVFGFVRLTFRGRPASRKLVSHFQLQRSGAGLTVVVAWNVAIFSTILICIDVIDDLREREDGHGSCTAARLFFGLRFFWSAPRVNPGAISDPWLVRRDFLAVRVWLFEL
jgi:hypothetical protein